MNGQPRGRYGDNERSLSRILGAAIAAGGLVFSASLYPLPGQRAILDLWQEQQGLSSGLPRLIDSAVANKFIDLAKAELPTLVRLSVVLHDNFPAVNADILLGAVEKYGLQRVVTSLEMLASSELPARYSAVLFGGGGGSGSGGGGGASPPNMLPDLALLLENFMQQLPVYLIQQLRDVIVTLLPGLVSPAQLQKTTAMHTMVAATTVGVSSPVAAITSPPMEIWTSVPTAPPSPQAPASSNPEPPVPAVEVTSTPSVESPPPPPPPPPVEVTTTPPPQPTLPSEFGDIGTDVGESTPTTPNPEVTNEDSGPGGEDTDQTGGDDGPDDTGSGSGDGGAPDHGDEGSGGTSPDNSSGSEGDTHSDRSGGETGGDSPGGD